MSAELGAPTDRGYGAKVVAVEPGGIERIPESERHGRPLQLAWTFSSPNLEFATLFVGVLAVAAFGLTFWQAVAAIVLGNLLGSVAQGILASQGPSAGVPQMVLGRLAFGYRGNVLPAGLMTITAGFGWIAVNSVSAAFALNSLTGLPVVPCLFAVIVLEIAVAFFGHNLVQAFERYLCPVLAVIFLAGAGVVLTHFDPAAAPVPDGAGGGIGGFLLAFGTVFSYAASWNPYAADYARYLPVGTSKLRTGLASGLGLFLATTILMVAGAASVSAATLAGVASDNPTSNYVGVLPPWLGALTLLGIALGAAAANVLNVYSGALAFLSLGFDVPLRRARAVIAVAFGVIGLVVALLALPDAAASYQAFLLVIVYWTGPWLGVVLTDRWLRRGRLPAELLYDRGHRNPAGVVALVAGIVVSVPLFSNQAVFTGLVARAVPAVGDITFLVGFVVSALVYAVLFRRGAT
jgi:purine-cytosine permease-like protein